MLQGIEERHVQVGLWLEHWCAADTVTANDITVQIWAAAFFWWGCYSSHFPVTGWSEPLLYPSDSLSFNSTPRCFEHFDLLGIHFLACCVSIWKWFWHDLYSHFPVLLRWWGGFLSLWPNKSDSCQREKEKKKNGIWNSPIRYLVEPSCNVFCFPSAWCSCKIENYKSRGGPKVDRND